MSDEPKIRVLVIDDSSFVRKAIARMLNAAPDVEVVGTASDGLEGLELARTLHPDVITLDIQMPRLDGLETLRRMGPEFPAAVLLLSSLTQGGADVTLRALELGALDFVDKSSVQGPMNMLDLQEELLTKVRALATRSRPHAPEAAPPLAGPLPRGTQRAVAVAIGTSTGGPAALQALIPALPADLPAAVLVVQHIPRGFSRSLADRLAAKSALPVREAQDGELVQPGTVLLAPAGLHMKLRRRGAAVRIALDEEPRAALHRPSVDVLMSAVARVYGPRGLGVILTGMGSDGTHGLRAIHEAGGRTLAESEESAVIFGMPKSAIEAGVVDRVAPLADLSAEILAGV